MDNLRFRAWQPKGKKMYDDLSVEDGTKGISLNGIIKSATEGLGIIIMQSTGLKDKNGKEIYEGDIVLWSQTNHGRRGLFANRILERKCGVYWDNDYKAWYIDVIDEGKSVFHPLSTEDKDISTEYERIGNIYENPNLLKDG